MQAGLGSFCFKCGLRPVDSTGIESLASISNDLPIWTSWSAMAAAVLVALVLALAWLADVLGGGSGVVLFGNASPGRFGESGTR
jgi:hypothetical protein